MRIADVISELVRESENESEVIFYLTALIDTLRSGDETDRLPEFLTALPLNGTDDVRRRFENLMGVLLDPETNALSTNAGAAVKEAARVFATGLDRLKSLQRRPH